MQMSKVRTNYSREFFLALLLRFLGEKYMILRRPLCFLWWKVTKPFSLLALKQMAGVTNENHQISYLANLGK